MRTVVRQELDAPARTYLLDIEGDAEQAVVRGDADFGYDGDDAEIMTIGLEQASSGRHRRCVASGTGRRGETAGRLRMLLEVRVDNDPALALYQRFGFERMGLRKRYYQPEGIDAYTMSWT